MHTDLINLFETLAWIKRQLDALPKTLEAYPGRRLVGIQRAVDDVFRYSEKGEDATVGDLFRAVRILRSRTQDS